MRLTHDDRMRALRARLANTAEPEALAEPAIRLTPQMLARARAVTAPALASPLMPKGITRRRYELARGSMAKFLAHARTVQNLPSFAMKGRRE